jgi:hypothetical protein
MPPSESTPNQSPVLMHPYSAFSRPLIIDDSTLLAIAEHMVLVQAGKEYLDGVALVGRTAALVNWMWTDLLRDKDSVGFPLHQEKLGLTQRYTYALGISDFETVVTCLLRYVDIRDALCKRWLSLALDANDGVAGVPSYAADYARKMFHQDGYGVLRDLYAQHGAALRGISPYTLEPIAALITAAKAERIAIMPLGAGGPGANCIAVSALGSEHLARFFASQSIEELQDDVARKIVRGDVSLRGHKALLRGYLPLEVGKNTLQITGFSSLNGVRTPELPLDAEYDPETGTLRVTSAGEQPRTSAVSGKWFRPRHDFPQGKPLDLSWIQSRLRVRGEAVRELVAAAKGTLEIVAHLRGVDGCGSSLDLPEFQSRLTCDGAKDVVEIPSTPTIASAFTVKIRFGLSEDSRTIVYEAPDYFSGDYAVSEVAFVPHADPNKRALGMVMPSKLQKDAPAFVFRNIFGLNGIKITCEAISPMALAGGMESSNAFNVALIAAASMLSGADLNYAEIFNLAVKIENDELNGLTGGQGHLSSILGGAYQHMWLSGLRQVGSGTST